MRGVSLKNNFWKAKLSRRGVLAKLPIKEKLRILVALQNLAYPILSRRKKNQLHPWKIV